MSKILEWIQSNSKEGANIAEAEELVNNSTFDGITTKEQAIDFMGKNAAFTSASDFLVQRAVQSNQEKFTTEKLPGLIEAEREKILKEFNPDETPEQKEIRELKEWKQLQVKRDAENDVKATLRSKAVELGYDPLRAERFSVYGENAMTELEAEAESRANAIQKGIEEGIKSKLAGDPPKGGKVVEPKDLDEKIAEARKEGNFARANQLQLQKTLNEKP